MNLNVTFMFNLLILSPMHNWTQHITSTSSCSMCPRLEKNKKSSRFCWSFPTNRAHALDLYHVLWAGHTSSKREGPSWVIYPLSYGDITLQWQRQHPKVNGHYLKTNMFGLQLLDSGRHINKKQTCLGYNSITWFNLINSTC